MAETTESVKINVSKSGVRSVSPADIFRSAKGQQAIRQTANAVKVKSSSNSSSSKASSS